MDTVKKWQRSFLYVKSVEGHDALNLREFCIERPSVEMNFKYDPADAFPKLQLIHDVLEDLLEHKLCTDDLLRVFVVHRVSPLQRREHRIFHMSGVLDPTWISKHDLDRASVKKRVKAMAFTEMADKWQWGVELFHQEEPPQQVSSQFPESLDTSR